MISHTPAAIKPGSLRSAAMRPASISARFKRWRRSERVSESNQVTETALSLAGAKPRPRPSILSIDPYVPGKSGAPGEAKVLKLSANETPLGASPYAKHALRDFASHLHDYPDGTA